MTFFFLISKNTLFPIKMAFKNSETSIAPTTMVPNTIPSSSPSIPPVSTSIPPSSLSNTTTFTSEPPVTELEIQQWIYNCQKDEYKLETPVFIYWLKEDIYALVLP